ncbi:protein of unknown function [Xenorhabdus poinarii G6]|uniref:Uncharacterized protein n=1 Tax=Xenorhabdus poinarii G6 TaxID=1354304 RepID=A0A068QZ65_9GAMM|nr:protein of unknown function [Xenorhabdus poinarii G6]
MLFVFHKLIKVFYTLPMFPKITKILDYLINYKRIYRTFSVKSNFLY